MIKVVNGSYGYRNPATGIVEPKTAKSSPFSLSPEREKELVEAGIAEYAGDQAKATETEEDSDEAPEFGPFKSKEQNLKAAAFYGVEVAEGMKNKEIVAAIEEKLSEDLPELTAEMPV